MPSLPPVSLFPACSLILQMGHSFACQLAACQGRKKRTTINVTQAETHVDAEEHEALEFWARDTQRKPKESTITRLSRNESERASEQKMEGVVCKMK